MNDKRKFAFDKVNFNLLAIGMAIVISVRRIKVAPVVCLFGFLSMIYAVLRKPKMTEVPKIKEE